MRPRHTTGAWRISTVLGTKWRADECSSALPAGVPAGGIGALTDRLGRDLYGRWRRPGQSSQPRLGFEPLEDRRGFLADLFRLRGMSFLPKPFRLLGQCRRNPE